jgi:hypothetical protein
MTELPEFSASRFNLYKTCARLYKYQYVDGFESNRHVYTVMGSALHYAIEQYYEAKENPMTTYTKHYYSLIESSVASANGLVATHLIGKAAQLGQSILRDMNWDRLRPKEVELGFRFPFPAQNPMVIMRGFIDMITEDGWIIDHKSGSKKPTRAELAHNPQLLLYVWAYEQMYGKKPEKVYWHHLRTLELVEAGVMEDFDKKIHELEKLLAHILSDTEFPKIEQGYFCNQVCAHGTLCWPQRDTYEESAFITGDF